MAVDPEFSRQVERWLLALPNLPDRTTAAVIAAIDLLVEDGPSLGRPVVGEISLEPDYREYVSVFGRHLKELRPLGTSIRILFTFDANRIPVLLCVGDKAGDWNNWYRTAIKQAAQAYRTHVEEDAGT